MLRLYRRHRVGCKHRSETYRRCQCPIYVKGTLGGESIRESLDQSSWDAASAIIASWVNVGRIGAIGDGKTLGSAVTDFLKDAEDRGLAEDTRTKYKLLLRRLQDYYRPDSLLTAATLDSLSKFRATWPGGLLAKSKTQERLKAFYGWCVKREWLARNPAASLSAIKVPSNPTLPFSDDDMAAILSACDRYPVANKYGHDNRARLKAMVLLLRWSGLRIQDAVTLEWSRIQDGRLFLYTQKTGTPVKLPLPQPVLESLTALPKNGNDYIFWHTGNGSPESAVSNWQRAFRRLFRLANITGGHAHRFRDTFAVGLLINGVPVEDVSILLGHTSIKTTQHSYSPWVDVRQRRLEIAVKSAWTRDDDGESARGDSSNTPHHTSQSQ